MATNYKTFSDDDLAQALIETNGQPTKAADKLGVEYITVWRRIKANPALEEVKQAYRGKTFNEINNLATTLLLAGIILEPELDKDGNIIDGKFVKRKVDYRTRASMIPNMMHLFKGDEGLKTQLEITGEGNVPISSWLQGNNTNDKNTEGI